MYHLALNTPPWGPNPALARIEETLSLYGVESLPVAWDTYKYVDDVHFTWDSHVLFCEWLAENLDAKGRWLVIADSTIGWYDSDASEMFCGSGSALLQSLLPRGSVVDAVNGSGFVARAREGLHVRARLRQWARDDFENVLFIVGKARAKSLN